jgi:transcriptional regulator with XRE-family HTH domain
MINLDESIGSRINSLIVSLGIKKVRFAEQIKVDQSYVTQLIKGRNYPSDRVIDNICRAFDVNEQWLRTGDGPMFVPIDKDKEFDRICMEIQLSDDEFIKDIMRKYWGLDENGKAIIRQMLAGLTDKKK